MKALIATVCLLVSVHVSASPICSLAAEEAMAAHIDVSTSDMPKETIDKYNIGQMYNDEYSLGTRLYVARWTDEEKLIFIAPSVIAKDIYNYCNDIMPILEPIKTTRDFGAEPGACDGIVLGAIYSATLMYSGASSDGKGLAGLSTQLRTREATILKTMMNPEGESKTLEEAKAILFGMHIFSSGRVRHAMNIYAAIKYSNSDDTLKLVQEDIAEIALNHCGSVRTLLNKKFM